MNQFAKLKVFCKKIGSGITPRGGDSVYIHSGVSLIRSQNVYNGTFTTQGLAFIDNNIAQKMKGVELEKKDILLNITGDSVARCCIVPDELLPARVNQHVSIIRTHKDKLDPQYLMYYLISPLMQARMLSYAGSGGTRKALTKDMLENFDIPVIKFQTQQKIASILYAYDDLINLNRRRIQLLEESARLLFREWFVYFRFPGYEKVRIVDGVPEGWKWERIDKIISFLGGHAFQSSSYLQEGLFGIVTIKNVQQGSFVSKCSDYIDDVPDKMKRHCFLKNGDVLISLTGNVGRVCIVYGENYLLNQRVAKIESKNNFLFTNFIYWMFDNPLMFKRIENLAYGSAQQNLSPVKLGEQRILIPTEDLIKSFEEYAKLITKEIIQLNLQNQKLTQARDLLLPRLMSGEIEPVGVEDF